MINVHNRIKYFLLVEIWNIKAWSDSNSCVWHSRIIRSIIAENRKKSNNKKMDFLHLLFSRQLCLHLSMQFLRRSLAKTWNINQMKIFCFWNHHNTAKNWKICKYQSIIFQSFIWLNIFHSKIKMMPASTFLSRIMCIGCEKLSTAIFDQTKPLYLTNQNSLYFCVNQWLYNVGY